MNIKEYMEYIYDVKVLRNGRWETVKAEPILKPRTQEEIDILVEYIEERKEFPQNLEDIRKFGDMWDLAKRIRNVLHSPANGYKGNKARAAICYQMFDHGLTGDQAIYVCMKTKHWKDQVENTPYHVTKAYKGWLKGKGKKDNHDENERGERPSEAKVFSPSLSCSQDIDSLIKTVKWRHLPDIDTMPTKSKIEAIREYFINRDDVFKTQRKPDKYHPDWRYEDIERKIEDKDIWRHLETGINPQYKYPYTLGIYDRSVDAKSKWICFDLDEKDNNNGSNLKNANLLKWFFELKGISPKIENASEGIESYHVWVFCEPMDIGILNAIGETALKETDINCELKPGSNYEVELGGIMRLPYGVNRKRDNKRSKILD